MIQIELTAEEAVGLELLIRGRIKFNEGFLAQSRDTSFVENNNKVHREMENFDKRVMERTELYKSILTKLISS
jgi:hypothetical protein